MNPSRPSAFVAPAGPAPGRLPLTPWARGIQLSPPRRAARGGTPRLLASRLGAGLLHQGPGYRAPGPERAGAGKAVGVYNGVGHVVGVSPVGVGPAPAPGETPGRVGGTCSPVGSWHRVAPGSPTSGPLYSVGLLQVSSPLTPHLQEVFGSLKALTPSPAPSLIPEEAGEGVRPPVWQLLVVLLVHHPRFCHRLPVDGRP